LRQRGRAALQQDTEREIWKQVVRNQIRVTNSELESHGVTISRPEDLSMSRGRALRVLARIDYNNSAH
jgi:hypothetical protein